jgi:hypothetical protein
MLSAPPHYGFNQLCFFWQEPFAANDDNEFFDFVISNQWESRSWYGLVILRYYFS